MCFKSYSELFKNQIAYVASEVLQVHACMLLLCFTKHNNPYFQEDCTHQTINFIPMYIYYINIFKILL